MITPGTPAFNCEVPRPRRALPSRRRGSVYMLVLGMGSLLTVIGLSVAVLARVHARAGADARNWTEAGALATSAIDLSVSSLNTDSSWRRNRTNDAWSTRVNLGNGSVAWKILDESDSDLADSAAEGVRIVGEATVGRATRLYSVQATSLGALPLPVLSTGAHSSTSVTIAGSVSCSGAPVSCDGAVTVGAGVVLAANVEAGSVVNTGSIVGFVTTPSSAKSVPGVAILSAAPYSGATEITYSAISGKIDQQSLSSGSNPYGTANSQGIYFIRVPAGQILTLSRSIFSCTLIVQLNSASTLLIEREMFWQPPATGMPSLIAYGGATATVRCRPDAGTVSTGGLSLLGIRLLGATAPSEQSGLFHVMGGASSILEYSTQIIGTWISDGPLTVTGPAKISFDPQLPATPPPGYTRPDNSLATVPGTFRWEAR